MASYTQLNGEDSPLTPPQAGQCAKDDRLECSDMTDDDISKVNRDGYQWNISEQPSSSQSYPGIANEYYGASVKCSCGRNNRKKGKKRCKTKKIICNRRKAAASLSESKDSVATLCNCKSIKADFSQSRPMSAPQNCRCSHSEYPSSGKCLSSQHCNRYVDILDEVSTSFSTDGESQKLVQSSERLLYSLVEGVDRDSDLRGLPPGYPVEFSIRRTSRHEKLVLFGLAVISMAVSACLSIMAPFFPEEAQRKGVNGTVSGLIFAIFPLVQFLTAPVYGKFLPVVGAKYTYLAGTFFAGGCLALFGCMDMISSSLEDSVLFTAFCFALRIFMALGCAASNTASFAIMAQHFPNNIATVFGVLETATGLGYMLGPALGGPLYELGGFLLPFLSLGCFMMLTVPVGMLLLPSRRRHQVSVLDGEPASMLTLLKKPSVIIVCVAVTMSAVAGDVTDPTLEPHLAVFKLSPSIVSLLFLLIPAFYGVFSPIWGRIADRMNNSTPLLFLGFVMSSVSLILLGPSPLFGLGPDYNELWLNMLSLSLLGIALSLATVPSFDKLLEAATNAGMRENLAMYGVVSGIWSSCFALGEFIGPSVAGWLMDIVDFGWTMTFTAGASAIVAALVGALWIHETTACCPRPCLARGPKVETPASRSSPGGVGKESSDTDHVVRREGSPNEAGATETTPLLRSSPVCT